jgi:hypothetical protein
LKPGVHLSNITFKNSDPSLEKNTGSSSQKTKWLMLYTKILTVYSETPKKTRKNTLHGLNAEFLNA